MQLYFSTKGNNKWSLAPVVLANDEILRIVTTANKRIINLCLKCIFFNIISNCKFPIEDKTYITGSYEILISNKCLKIPKIPFLYIKTE